METANLLTLARDLAATAKASNGSIYDAAYEMAHDYVSPDHPDAGERLAEIAYAITNLANALLKD